MPTKQYDVIVVGAGNAALCAALSAREHAENILVLEKAPVHERGGNSYFTGGGFRFAHQGLDDVRRDVLADLTAAEVAIIDMPPYSAEQFYDDLMSVTDGQCDEDLARTLIGQSRATVSWLGKYRVRWIPMFNRQSHVVAGIHRFYGGLTIEANGGGAGLVTALFAAAEKQNIEVRYETCFRRLIQDKTGRVVGVEARGTHGIEKIPAHAVILACGGFEANPEWRARYLGSDWELCRVRGTRHNTGDGLRAAFELDAEPYGNWSSCHAVAWDISAPPFGDRRVGDGFQKHSYTLGIVVNVRGERFIDEGANFRTYTYAKYGREIIKQPKRTAIQIFDGKTLSQLRPEYGIHEVTKVQANSISELAKKLEIDAEALVKTVSEFNAACSKSEFNPGILDGTRTHGVVPPKSNWALPIDTPPYVAYVTTCGITFTFGGLHINSRSEVQDTTDRNISGLYAAGEMVGGLFYNNYPGGSGLMAGAVFGRIAGSEAARYAMKMQPTDLAASNPN